MFINRYLAAFARGHGGKITVTCFLQLILTLLGTMISLGVAFVVRMLQGEARILFFSELWQVFAAIGICIALRYALSRKKMLAAEQCNESSKQLASRRFTCRIFVGVLSIESQKRIEVLSRAAG